MNAPAKPLLLYPDAPRRSGAAWQAANTARGFRLLRALVLTRFISVLGALSTPGMKPVGVLQAWALRRMGAKCPSSQVWIGAHVYFDYPQNLEFGRRITIGSESRLTARSTIVLGDDFLSAPGLMINTGTHDPVTLVPQSSPVVLGAGIWCGARVTIGAGVSVGDGVILGAGSVVLKDIPAHHLAYGVPCKPQRALPPQPPGRQWSNFRPGFPEPTA